MSRTRVWIGLTFGGLIVWACGGSAHVFVGASVLMAIPLLAHWMAEG